jgi:hypothetical protein
MERPLVKTLHAIHEIAARIAEVDGDHIHLTRDFSGAIGLATDLGSQQLSTGIDPQQATVAALAQPLDYPPLAAGIVPGDQVAIALDSAIPCAGAIVRGAIQALTAAGVERDCISVVSCDSSTNQICRDAAAAEEANGVKFVVHDADDEENLCLVGVSKRGEPYVVNRVIFDADIVLPIGCPRYSHGAYESLFPQFSDAEAIRRYRTPSNIASAAAQKAETRETNEAGWLIGVPMVVEVVPGPGDSVAHVLAGEPNAVALQSQELSRDQWHCQCPRQASLMIATITGGPEAQSWTNVGRALATAEYLVADGGAVAICSNLSEPPGHSLGRLIRSDDLESAERKIFHDHDADSWPAWQLARALQRGPVFFLSQLDPETVEDLGLAPVENIDELVRLAARHDSFILVDDAQNAVVTLAGDVDES